MAELQQRVADFLAQKRIAVAGVSRSPQGSVANLIYRKLRDTGHTVFALNPAATTVEGDRCYPDLKSLPERVDAVVIATRPEVAEGIVRECVALGVKRVWMHRSFGTGSVSEGATRLCQAHDISVIAGACPMMYAAPVDLGHRCMRWLLGVTGGLPR